MRGSIGGMIDAIMGPSPDRAAIAAAVQDDPRWAAVAGRTAARRHEFVFAVATTGIYCRPGCPARTPRPEHVRFFAEPAAARRAGFRACRRCRPDAVAADAGVAAVIAAIAARLHGDGPVPSLRELGAAVGLSPSHLQRTFRAAVGLSPREFAAARRAARVREQLAAGASVTAALHAAGYGAASRFYAVAEPVLGMAPQRYRRGGAGETLQVAVAPSSLGLALVAATGRGVAAVLLGSDEAALRADLRRRLPRAVEQPADEAFAALVARVIAAVDATGPAAGLPLDLRGTAFQQRVWQALREIPRGRTCSYAELAAAVGAPRAVRAVAAACAANPVAVVVPCHRVVRGDGDLAGYRWGIERKRQLLRREAAEPGR